MYTALRSNLTSLAFARLYPFDPYIRRERVRPTLRRSAMVALSGAGLEMVSMLPLLSAMGVALLEGPVIRGSSVNEPLILL